MNLLNIDKSHITIGITIITLTFLIIILSVPLIYMRTGNSNVYKPFSLLCHQMTERSYCMYFNLDSKGFIRLYSCKNVSEPYSRQLTVHLNNQIGYKLPVCSRCFAFYLFMAIGSIFCILRKNDKLPPLWIFVMFISPLAVDGLGQFIGLWESNNTIRFITGGLSGFICAVYLIPILKKTIMSSSCVNQ